MINIRNLNKDILITGATGLLGSQLLKLLILKSKARIVIIGRGKSVKELVNRTQKVLKIFDHDLSKKLSKENRFKFIVGDIAKTGLGIDKEEYLNIASSVGQIYHSAALTSFNASEKDLMLANVEGTRNILEFGCRCKELKSVECVSSIYVVGKYQGRFSEDDLSKNQKFNNFYEHSKFLAEALIRKYMARGLKVNIYRPSVIVGDSVDGRVINPGLLYHFFRLIKFGIMNTFPFDEKAKINIIPCDEVAKIIYLFSNTSETNKVYHVLSSNNFDVKEVVTLAFKHYSKVLNKIISPKVFIRSGLSPVQQRVWAPFLPYLQFRSKISSDITRSRLKKYDAELPFVDIKFIEKILEYFDKQK